MNTMKTIGKYDNYQRRWNNMMIIRQTRDIHSNNTLGEYLNKNNIEYSSHTYNSTQLTIYKIFTDSEEHLKIIDKITGEVE